ncbi:MAG TPA: aminotransferase class I/II-fold pyridoxal phosphate-dependent enzyme, partial [Paludibacteraceae bacterium]|nr:aminotransferase class I/II-fold pyridoxal phosphate-dependent enzyme [Paludibacteraceae bacterium]
YDVIVIEDLAYFGMDFRQNYGLPGESPYQPTVAHYTDNYILLLSASKIFSYAGQRIGMMIFSEQTYTRRYPNLKNYFTSDTLGHFIPYGVLYATTAGTAHTAQYALAAMLRAANDGHANFVENLHLYGQKARLMKEAFLKHGFYIVYNDDTRELADGFYFTIAYPGLTSGQLMNKFLHYGISAISLAITGSDNPNGLRACVSFVRLDQIPVLNERLTRFVQDMK